MKVKMGERVYQGAKLVEFEVGEPVLETGGEYEVPDAFGKWLVGGGFAKEVKAKAVPKKQASKG